MNPGIEPSTHHYVTTGQEDSKFGLSLDSGAADVAVQRLRRLGSLVELVGVHTHIGSQLLDLVPLHAAVESVAEFALEHGFVELCVGGGLGIAYTGEAAPSIKQWAAVVHDACVAACLPESVRVTAEPGRAIVGAAAVTCYTIGTIKELPGIRTYVSVDGGMSDNLRPALYGSQYEAFLARQVTADRPKSVSIVGSHCESGDVIVSDGYLPTDTVIGDIVVTPATGAYGYSMASSYNMMLRPPVVFARDGAYRTVLRRETQEDLLRLER